MTTPASRASRRRSSSPPKMPRPGRRTGPALWNEAEASETRRNSVTAREWELSLPSEISAEDRSQITRQFAEQLVSRYGVAVDVAIHAPHREGDQRNHHAHVLTTTRKLEAEGFTAKTRVLDSAKTGGAEIEQMRGVWAELQNRALERVGEVERVDHRSLETQRETALDQGDTLSADELDRDPELKLGPAANSMERREKAAAEREGREYVPVTERGAVVHAARQARMAFQDMRERLDVARETYGGRGTQGRGVSLPVWPHSGRRSIKTAVVSVGPRMCESGWRGITDRGRERDDTPEPEEGGGKTARDRLKDILDREASDTPQATTHKLDGHSDREHGVEAGPKPSIRERLDDVLNKPREKLEIEDEREVESEKEIDNEREIDREVDQ